MDLSCIKDYVYEYMSEYYSKGKIDIELSAKIKKVELNDNCSYIDMISFDNGVLKLPKYFFDMDINIQKQYLAIFGIYILSINSYDSEEEKLFKNSLATYLVTKKNIPEIEKIKFDESFFDRYDFGNYVLTNIFEQLEIVLGKDVLVNSLIKGSYYLIDEIDNKTKKNGLGKKIFTNINKLKIVCDDILLYSNLRKFNFELIKNKLLPIYEFLDNNISGVESQNTMLNLLEMNDFNYSILKRIDKHDSLSRLGEITDVEKERIKYFVSIFDKYNYNMSDEFLSLDYPCISDKGLFKFGKNYYGNELFSFINKYITVANKINIDYCDNISLFYMCLENICELIMYSLVSRYIKFNKDTDISLEKLFSLSSYKFGNYEYDLSEKRGTKLLERKINLDRNLSIIKNGGFND